MNELFSPFTPEDQRLLDRLVDGELSERQRRDFITSLEARSDGWRRCALAFLESQSWGQDLRSLVAPRAALIGAAATALSTAPAIETSLLATTKATKPTVAPPTVLHRAARRIGWFTPLAIAASFFLAFSIVKTAYEHGWWGLTPVANGNSSNAQLVGSTPDRRSNSMITVAFPDDRGGPTRAVQLPLVESSSDDDWMSNQRPPVSQSVREALQRSGREIDQQREIVPIQLEDGRRVYVPIDQVRVRYVGNRAFQ